MSFREFVHKTGMEGTRRDGLVFVAASTGIALATLFAVTCVAGFGEVAARLRGMHPAWFAVALAAEITAYVGYTLGYREVARVEEGPEMSHGTAVAAVAAGFGPFVARGGFAVDLHAFRQTGISEREARVRVLGLGALEYALLAPAACIASIELLARGVHRPSPGFTLPWAILVPLGFVAALWAVQHRDRFHGRGGWREPLAQALESVHVLRCLVTRPRHVAAPLGTAVYWFGDIVCLWACLHAFTHGTPSVPLLLIGYATGYALTRRTLPLAGAGAVEALLPFALSWMGIALPAAVLAVFMYRVFNLWLPMVPAAVGLRSLRTARA
ncbi:MAG TPA: lysylphosphatidylglycerol synthase transmembrane domain-containing protein [Gaiellaceae bacterium]|nr:lysylphosphatidylglycerol synthase transmembrane domain-containing protein [Gaiellaceae bacterium]